MKKRSVIIFILFLISSTLIAQPEPEVRMCAEWEPAAGTLIRWPLGIPLSLVIELAEDDYLYVLVENEGEETAALSVFSSIGANLENVDFIYSNTYSHWTRDWGPVSIFDGNGVWAIVDPIFDGYPWVPGGRDWSEDDQVNSDVAEHFSCDLFQLPAYLTGGNIMVDGLGTAFSTQQMVDENLDLMDEDTFFVLTEEYCGITEYHIVNNTEIYGIQHLDCAAKLLDEETVMIKELPAGHPETYRIDQLVEYFSNISNCFGRPYKIHRIYCGSYDGNSVAAYTNSLILNKKVLVPLFDIDSDEQALIAYEQAMPGYEVIGFPYSTWYYYDALHCRIRAIFDRYMLRMYHKRLDEEVEESEEYEISVFIDDRSEEGLIESELRLFWKEHNSDLWNEEQLLPTTEDDIYQAYIPAQDTNVMIDYYLQAADLSGRIETLPRTAPAGFYSFQVIPSTSVDDKVKSNRISSLVIYPNPLLLSNGTTENKLNIGFNLNDSGFTEISIVNLKGQILHKYSAFLINGLNHIDIDFDSLTNGIYFMKVNQVNDTKIKKFLVVK